jgi:hypothetical protein
MENQDYVTAVTSQNAPSRAELEQYLRARAWKDDAFRQEFLTNPKAVLERDYAQWFPEGIPSEHSIKVIEEEEQAIYFVLPPKKAADDNSETDEISDEDLFEMSGGTSGNTICACYSYDVCSKPCTGLCTRWSTCPGSGRCSQIKLRL